MVCLPRSLLALLAAALGPAAAATAQLNDMPPATPPNFVLIVLDDLGTDKLGIYGQAPIWGETHARTPTLDRLRQNGVLFRRAHGSPLCSPSRAMIMSGRHAFRTGMFYPTSFYALPCAEVFLPEMLKGSAYPPGTPAYLAGAFGKWHLAGMTPCHAVGNGFDIFQGQYGNGQPFGGTTITASGPVPCGSSCTNSSAPTNGWSAAAVQADARTWIQSAITQARPFLAYVAFNPPHSPYSVPPLAYVSTETIAELATYGLAFEGATPDPPTTACTGRKATNAEARVVYKAMIEGIDYQIGQLLGTTAGQVTDLPANTYVFVVGDNGTDEPVVQADVPPAASGAPFPGLHAKFTVYDLGVRIPLVAFGPGIPANQSTSGLVSSVDFWKTFADLAGADTSPLVLPGPIDSVSFRSLLEHPTGPQLMNQRTHVYTEVILAANGYVYQPAGCSGTWTPSDPSVNLQYNRALINRKGFKYIRRAQSGPGCATNACSSLFAEEELYRVLGAVPTDDNELTTLACQAGYATLLAQMRQTMTCDFSGP